MQLDQKFIIITLNAQKVIILKVKIGNQEMVARGFAVTVKN
jgi:hypothetical protein